MFTKFVRLFALLLIALAATSVALAQEATPEATQTAFECADAPAPRLTVGTRGQVVSETQNSGSHVRKEANGKSDSLATIDSGVSFDVIGGPECVESPKYGHLIWWQIRLDDETEGWITEGGIEEGNTEYWIEPAQPSIIGYWIGEEENLYIIEGGYINVYDQLDTSRVIIGTYTISGDKIAAKMTLGEYNWDTQYTFRVVGKSLLLTQNAVTKTYTLQD